MIKIKRVLISVSDKQGIVKFAKQLQKMKIEIISTGGTAKILMNNKIPVRNIADFTGYPEILDGRVKTLHPKIYGALLAVRNKQEHLKQTKKYNIELIDMVIVNLYPFESTISKKEATQEEIIENIDIGGPTMLRAAAKNYENVVVITDAKDYETIIEEMRKNKGKISKRTSLRLASKVFERTSQYDKLIYQYFNNLAGGEIEEDKFPQQKELVLKKVQDLRYGENPHQKAALYKISDTKEKTGTITDLKQLHGKEISFNNIMDLNANLEIVKEFSECVAVIMKHNNPCGAAVDAKQLHAYKKALSCDPVSAFGSIVGFNQKVTKETAEEISKNFVECVLAPDYTDEALNILKQKKNIRLISVLMNLPRLSDELDYKKVSGGMLVQELDNKLFTGKLKVVTKKKPSPEQMNALKFAWKVCKHIKSNAILLANKEQTLGIGAGQMSRIDSVKIAIMKMHEFYSSSITEKNLVLASDAFFPFRDSIDEVKKVGVTAIIQPGGSIRDQDVIDACNEYNIAMVFTEMRHFRH